jgi:hypothetical protein
MFGIALNFLAQQGWEIPGRSTACRHYASINRLHLWGVKIHDFSLEGSWFFHGGSKEKDLPRMAGQIFYEMS